MAEATLDGVYAVMAHFDAVAAGIAPTDGVHRGRPDEVEEAEKVAAALRRDLLPAADRLAAALRSGGVDEAAIAALDTDVHAAIAKLFDEEGTKLPAESRATLRTVLSQELDAALEIDNMLRITRNHREVFTRLGVQAGSFAGRSAEATAQLRAARDRVWAAGASSDLTPAHRVALVGARIDAGLRLAELQRSLAPVLEQLATADEVVRNLEGTYNDARQTLAQATSPDTAVQAETALHTVASQVDRRVQAVTQQRQRLAERLASADTSGSARAILPDFANAVKLADELRKWLSRERGAMLETWIELDEAGRAVTASDSVADRTRLGLSPLAEQVSQRAIQARAAVDTLLATMAGPQDETRSKALAAVLETRRALEADRMVLTGAVGRAVDEANRATRLDSMDEAALDRMLDEAVRNVDAGWGSVELVRGEPDSGSAQKGTASRGTRTVRFKSRAWAEDPYRHSFDVELRFASLPEGVSYTVRVPSDADSSASVAFPTTVVEISAALIGTPELDAALLMDAIAESGEKVWFSQRGLWSGDSTDSERRPGWLRIGPWRLSGGDNSRWRRLTRAAAHERSHDSSGRVVRLLTEMGLLTDQPDSARRRPKLAGRITNERDHRLIALRMLDTRSAADGKKVLAAVDAQARRYASRPDAAITGVELLQDSGGPLLTVQLPASDGQRNATFQIPVRVDDAQAVPGSAVRLETGRDGALTVVVRSDASDQAVTIDVAGTLAELALLRGEPDADPASRAVTRTAAQLNTLFGLRELAPRVERIAMNHMAAELLRRFRAVGVSATDDERMTTLANWKLRKELAVGVLTRFRGVRAVVTDPLLGMLNADAGPTQRVPLHRLFARPLRPLIGPPDPATPGLGFHQFRRMLSASGAWLYAMDTNPYAERTPDQTEMTRNRAFVRDGSQAFADNKAAGIVASQSAPVQFALPSPEIAPSVYRWITHPDRGENWAKRLGGAAGGGVASAVPLWGADPDDFDGPPVQGRMAQLALSAYVLGAEIGGTGFGQAEADYVKDRPEREASAKEKHEVSLSPDSRRNSAAGMLTYPLTKLHETLRKLRDEGGALDPQERMRLMELLRQLRADLTEAQNTMADEVEHKLADMEYRRRRLQLFRRAGDPPVSWVDGQPVTYTMTGRGYASGAPRLFDNMGRVTTQQVPASVNSVLMQIALSTMKSQPPDEAALALRFTVANGAINVVGYGPLYGVGWSRVKLDEVADRQAVDAWDARRAIEDALQDIDVIEKLVWGNDLTERSAEPRPRRSSWRFVRQTNDRILIRLASSTPAGLGDAARQRVTDRLAGRPNEVYWRSQLLYKHGPAILGRLAVALISGALLVGPFGAARPLLTRMLLGSAKYAGLLAVGETPMRVWAPAHKRAQARKALHADMATRPDSLVGMAQMAAGLGETVKIAAARIKPAPVVGYRSSRDREADRVARAQGQLFHDTLLGAGSRAVARLAPPEVTYSDDGTPSRRDRLIQGGRDLRYFNAGLRDHLGRNRPSVLRPGPNRPELGTPNTADRAAMRRVHERLVDLERAARLAERNAPPLTGLPVDQLEAELVRELAAMGLLEPHRGNGDSDAEPAAATGVSVVEARWKTVEEYLWRRYGRSTPSLWTLRRLSRLDPDQVNAGPVRDALVESLAENSVRNRVTVALQRMADNGRVGLDEPLRMVEFQDEDTLRFTVEVRAVDGHVVGQHSEFVRFEVAPLPIGLDGQLRPASPGEVTRRLLIAPQAMLDPARLADLFSVILLEVQESGGWLPPGVQDIRPASGNIPRGVQAHDLPLVSGPGLAADPDQDGPDEDGPDQDGPDEDGPDQDGPDQDGPDQDGPGSGGPAPGGSAPPPVGPPPAPSSAIALGLRG
ncbi:hypothetical protein ACWENR_10745 [Micromonospora sp. NPDC004336]